MTSPQQPQPPGYLPPRRDFIGKPAPPGYVAGIGRGATGFTTRSDIGPAREAAFVKPDDGAGPSTSRGQTQVARRHNGNNDDEEDEIDLNESNYDEFTGYGGSLVARLPYDEDDEEADKTWNSITERMAERGQPLREKRARLEREALQKKPKLQQHFVDLKSELRAVSEEEWASIPEVGDARNRKQRVARQDKFTPVPDSLLAHQAKLASGGENLVYIEPGARDHDESDDQDDGNDNDDDDNGGRATQSTSIGSLDRKPDLSGGDPGQALNIGEMSEFRSSYMSMRLSRVSDRSTIAGRATATNAQDYLTNLQSMAPNQISDTAAVNEYRRQFAALRKSNPTFPNGWIASVRLEEASGKIKAARTLIMEACEAIPRSADLWLEAARLHPPDMVKPIMIKALKSIPRSVKLWIKAAELERDTESKRRVFAKARDLVPNSALLWKKSVELEKEDQARALLKQAVQKCPESPELWVALSRLLPYEEANQTLKEANERNPKDRSIWLTAAKLQEHAGKLELIEKIINLSVSDLAEKGAEIVRDEWLREAVDADRANCKHTSRAIIKRIIGWNVPEEERQRQLLRDARDFVETGSIECARAVFAAMIEERSLCKLEQVWREFVSFEQKHGTRDSLIACLELAVKREHCPKSESLWLLLANQMRDHLDECRQTLERALDANPGSERIVEAAIELESANGNPTIARRILENALKAARSPQLVMRAARLEWSLGNLDEALRILRSGVQEYKNFTEFYLSLGQIEEQRNDTNQAKSWYSGGLKFNPTSVELWVSMAKLEERTGHIAKARSRLEMARLRNPKNVQLWLESAELEWRQYQARAAGGPAATRSRPDMVITILAKGIRECRDKPDAERLVQMQAEVSAKRFG